MNDDRPVEPYSSSEEPEQWAAIAEYEGERADLLGERVNELEAQLKEIADHIHYPDCWEQAKAYPTLLSAIKEIIIGCNDPFLYITLKEEDEPHTALAENICINGKWYTEAPKREQKRLTKEWES